MITDLATRLLIAARTREPIDPLPDITIADAYAIQLSQISTRLAEGAKVTGHKVGLTSAAMQRQLGVDQPDFGHLLDDMEITSGHIRTDRFVAPRAEPEIAFVLDSRLTGPGLSTRDVAAAVRCVLPAIEVIDSRIRDWRIGLTDTIADNASSGAYILGTKAVPLDRLDPASLGCIVRVNGEIVETGAGAAVLGDPLTAVTWLANALGANGTSLEPGHVVLSGSLTKAVALQAGTISMEFAHLGHISVHIEEKD